MKTKTGRASRGLSCASVEALENRALFAAGDLDGSFGAKGVVKGHAAMPVLTGLFGPQPAAIDGSADGRFVVAGTLRSTIPAYPYPSPDHLLLARFLSSGTLDSSFGKGGYVSVAEGTDERQDAAFVKAVKTDSKGRYLVADATLNAFFLTRFTADGKLDSTFGTGGRVVTELGYRDSTATITALPDGRIVLGVKTYTELKILRFRGDGTPDPTFNSGAPFDDFGSDLSDKPLALADGRIILTNTVTGDISGNSSPHIQVICIASNGKLDPTFGTDGAVEIAGFSDFQPSTAIGVADGKVVVLGHDASLDESTGEVISGPIVFRLTRTGTLDSTFGRGGFVRPDTLTPLDIGYGSTLLGDTAGGVRILSTTGKLGRLTLKGAVDTQFAGKNKPVYTFDPIAGVETSRNHFAAYVVPPPFGTVGDDWQPTFDLRTLDATTGKNTQTSFARLPSSSTNVAVRPDGRLFASTAVLDDQEFRAYQADGKLDPTFAGGVLRRDGLEDRQGKNAQLIPLSNNVAFTFTDYQSDIGFSVAIAYQTFRPDGTDAKYADQTVGSFDETGLEYISPLPHGRLAYVVGDTVGSGAGDVLFPSGGHASVSTRDLLPPGVEYSPSNDDQPYFLDASDENGGVVIQFSMQQSNGDAPPDPKKFLLARTLPNGKLDPTFGRKGLVIGFDQQVVLLQPDGKIVYLDHGKLKRLNTNGSPDTSFSSSTLIQATDHFTEDERGRIIVWRQLTSGVAKGDIQIAMLLPDGAPDLTFGGGDGLAIVDTVQTNLNGNVLVTPANEIVVTNYTATNGSADWSATRLQGSAIGGKLADGTFAIYGSPSADNISVTQTGTNLIVTLNGDTQSFSTAGVKKIAVLGYAGNDLITMNVSLPTSLLGGDGNDTLAGGAGADSIYGGAGNDVIIGAGGRDSLFGEAGNDTIYARDNAVDRVDGGTGTDRAQRDNTATIRDDVLGIEAYL